MAEGPEGLWFPDGYGQDTADSICDRLADGESLRKICRSDDMPSTSTVCKWLGKNGEFAEQYARAREMQADALFDDCLDIADQYDKASDSGEGGNDNRFDSLFVGTLLKYSTPVLMIVVGLNFDLMNGRRLF